MAQPVCGLCGQKIRRPDRIWVPFYGDVHLACHAKHAAWGKADALATNGSTSDLNKDTNGKTKLSWTMRSMMEAIAAVREYGNKKYKTNAPDNWEKVDPKEWHEALLRHAAEITEAVRNNEPARFYDKESGLLHLAHIAVCVMFQIELIARTGEANWLYQPSVIVNKEEQK